MTDDNAASAANDSPGVAVAPRVAAPASPGWPRAAWPVVGALAVLCLASLALAWKAEQRGASLELELVRRQQDSATQATEARVLAKQAQQGMAETSAKLALLDARVAEVAVQRSQLEELMQSLSRSRDENLLSDIDAALRVAQQQIVITGSAEPLVAALKQSDERIVRANQPRLDGVRRAIARDLDRVKAVSVADISSLGIKLDEAIRMIDDLPLLAVAEPHRRVEAEPPAAPPKPASAAGAWASRFGALWSAASEQVWSEVRSLVRVTRVEHPDAVLLAPEQSFFVRENLKLRLLNARLALLGRQFDTAQSDLQAAQAALDRYFDRAAKRTVLARELLRQVAGQARQVSVPRPDDTLAALAAATAGR